MSELEQKNDILSSWTLINDEGEFISGDNDSDSSDNSIEVLSIDHEEYKSYCSQHNGQNSDCTTVELDKHIAISAGMQNVCQCDNRVSSSETEIYNEIVDKPEDIALKNERCTFIANKEKDPSTEVNFVDGKSLGACCPELLQERISISENSDENDLMKKICSQPVLELDNSITLNNDNHHAKEDTDSESDIVKLEFKTTETDKPDFSISYFSTYRNEEANYQEESIESCKNISDFKIDNNEDYKIIDGTSSRLFQVCDNQLASSPEMQDVSQCDDRVSSPENEIVDLIEDNDPKNGGSTIVFSKENDPFNKVNFANGESLGACCSELLQERLDNSENTEEKNLIKQVSSLSVLEMEGCHMLKGSDSDSDSIKFEGNISEKCIRHELPVSSSSRYSILRNDGGESDDQDFSRYLDDLDDDTESYTEEGVDDRIESEQSEVGSFTALNDNGDWSVLADIGDLPLDVGNVPRNYIHSPNNYLSTILNLVVLLTAILTMGISLGVIVGTDLEIEEWQNALTKQSMKMADLEKQMEDKIKEVKHLKLTTKSYENAFEQILHLNAIKGTNSEAIWKHFKEAIDDFIECDKSLFRFTCWDDFVFPECERSIKLFLDNYTLIEFNSTFAATPDKQEPVNFDIAEDVTKGSYHQKNENHKALHSQAFPVTLDIKNLQHSLSREQQRALRWQHLYLAERRQKERERENEEWEDERDREIWENEKEQMDQIECLKKLMLANVTELKELSVLDDFANLSLLLTGVAELKQSVMNTVQNVWKQAEVLFDNEPNKNSETLEQEKLEEEIKKLLYIEVQEILQTIQDWPDKETLLNYLSSKAAHIVRLIQDVLLPSSKSYKKVWRILFNLCEKINKKSQEIQSINHVKNMKESLEEFTQLFYDIKQELDLGFVTTYAQNENFEESVEEKINLDPVSNSIPQGPDYSKYAPNLDSSKKTSSWPKKLGRLLKKTGTSVQHKIKSTWQKIKSTTWHKLKHLWHEKKPYVMKAAQDFTDNVISFSSKFKKLCLILPKYIFNIDGKVDIYCKNVFKARKQWQKDILHNPCSTVGKFSLECNTAEKKLKKDVKKINQEFNKILKLNQPSELKKVKPSQAQIMYQKLKLFHDRWGSSKLLLKTDQRWIVCQANFWLNVMKNNEKLDFDHCNFIRLQDNLNEIDCDTCKAEETIKETLKNNDDQPNKVENISPVDLPSQMLHNDSGYSIEDEKESILKEKLSEDQVNDWYLERAHHRLQSRKEKGKADWIFEMAADRERQRKEENVNWMQQKAEYRKKKRKGT